MKLWRCPRSRHRLGTWHLLWQNHVPSRDDLEWVCVDWDDDNYFQSGPHNFWYLDMNAHCQKQGNLPWPRWLVGDDGPWAIEAPPVSLGTRSQSCGPAWIFCARRFPHTHRRVQVKRLGRIYPTNENLTNPLTHSIPPKQQEMIGPDTLLFLLLIKRTMDWFFFVRLEVGNIIRRFFWRTRVADVAAFSQRRWWTPSWLGCHATLSRIGLKSWLTTTVLQHSYTYSIVPSTADAHETAIKEKKNRKLKTRSLRIRKCSPSSLSCLLVTSQKKKKIPACVGRTWAR